MYYSIYDQNSRLRLTINLTPLGFTAGFKQGTVFHSDDRKLSGHK